MTRPIFRLSIILAVAASLTGMNAAHAQKDSGQAWSPQMGPPGLQAPGAIPNYGQPAWGQQSPLPGAGPNSFAQQTRGNWGGAQPGPNGFAGGGRPGTTWSQGPGAGSYGGQSQSDNWAQQQARNAEMTRQALQAQANAPVRPQVAQYERWKQEWAQQHPGEPLPNMPTLERLHHGEIMSNIQQQGADMWARRRQEVQWQYQMARQMQEKKNAAAHITWSKGQWAQFDKEYDQQQHQNAIDYVNNAAKSGEDARLEESNRQYRQSLGLDH